MNAHETDKSLESWIWDAACSIRVDGHIVWLTQLEIAELFQTTKQNINLHAKNIFKEGELAENATVKESLTVAAEVGSRKKAFDLIKADHKLVKNAVVKESLTTAADGKRYKTMPKARQGKVFLANAGLVFEKGDPKNFIQPEGIARIADTLIRWKEADKFSRIVAHAELKKNDYNISPSRYIHTGDAETYRPIAETVGELDVIEVEEDCCFKSNSSISRTSDLYIFCDSVTHRSSRRPINFSRLNICA